MPASDKLSFSEISKHTSKDDCWLIIHGKVYNVTDFLEDHPGGDDVLLQAAANGDATQSFEDVGHSSTATSMMEGYVIGSIDGDQVPKVIQTGTADPHLADKPQERKLATSSTNFTDVLFPLLILALAFAAWYYLTYINVSA
ncbi:cytochrome b5-like [Phalaenopsis equestris]|uniref:cytochrome b5-like n=1 Tax=Phalaenopsis equestris TaxID=78828 RepID=UPI0009E45712|nr:cytochrome b5-like [Phalaenopsis equestris]XP_020592296.1 cytochrome b5-like [Phalaenopsis equestris]